MDRLKKIELIQRSLGLRHKLKVHETMKAAETHEELAITLLAKWELEDELHAVEELLSEDRLRNTAGIKDEYVREIKQSSKEAAEDDKESPKKKNNGASARK